MKGKERTRRRHPRPGCDLETSRPRTPSFWHASVSDATTEYSRRLIARSGNNRVFQSATAMIRSQRRQESDSGVPGGTSNAPGRFGEWIYLRASRSGCNGRQDFQARGYGGLHGVARRAILSLSLSFSLCHSLSLSLSTKAGTREKYRRRCGLNLRRLTARYDETTRDKFNVGLARTKRTRSPSRTSPRGTHEIYVTTDIDYAREKAKRTKEKESEREGEYVMGRAQTRNGLSLLHNRSLYARSTMAAFRKSSLVSALR